jgi:hypothetical protein
VALLAKQSKYISTSKRTSQSKEKYNGSLLHPTKSTSIGSETEIMTDAKIFLNPSYKQETQHNSKQLGQLPMPS